MWSYVRSLGVSCCALLVMAATLCAAPASYTLTDLGPYSVTAIDPDSTTTAGQAFTVPLTAVRLTPTVQVLGLLISGGESLAMGVAGGTVVGWASTDANRTVSHAFRWTAATGMQDLGTPGLRSFALGINAAGTIVGAADSLDRRRTVPVVWTAGQLSLLPTARWGDAAAHAINAPGDIVGYAPAADPEVPGSHAVLWPVSGGMMDLHTSPALYSSAAGINSAGQVVGATQTLGEQFQGFIWSPLRGMLPLPPLAGDTDSAAEGIDEAGTVVGTSWRMDRATDVLAVLHEAAVRWVNGQPEALQRFVTVPGWVLEGAAGINAAGVIIGNGTLNGQARAWMLVPDTTPPMITIAATPALLWPLHGTPVPVTIAGTILDAGAGVDPSTAVYEVTDEYGRIQPCGPIPVDAAGRYAVTIHLRASRHGKDQDGRQYLITVSAHDHAGNMGSAATSVTVAHDQGHVGVVATR